MSHCNSNNVGKKQCHTASPKSPFLYMVLTIPNHGWLMAMFNQISCLTFTKALCTVGSSSLGS